MRLTYRQKAAVIIAAIIIFFGIAFFTKCALEPEHAAEGKDSQASDGSVTAGIAEIQSLSERDITDIEEKLRMLEKFERMEQIQAGNFKVIFDDSVILGDSHAEGLTAYGLLDESRVAAVKGRNLKYADEDLEKAVSLRPSNVFLNYGMNDAVIYGKNIAQFTELYSSFIDRLRESLPDADIFVCSIFEAEPAAFNKQPSLAYIPEYNAAVKAMCEEKGIVFIDTTGLLTEKYYEPDHVHTNAEYHRVWLNYIASEASLLDVENWYWEG